MKKILLFSLLFLFLINLRVYGACPLKDIINGNSSCTGGASVINNAVLPSSENKIPTNNNLNKDYQIPTMAVPSSYQNNFPIINPNQGCPFGTCLPK